MVTDLRSEILVGVGSPSARVRGEQVVDSIALDDSRSLESGAYMWSVQWRQQHREKTTCQHVHLGGNIVIIGIQSSDLEILVIVGCIEEIGCLSGWGVCCQTTPRIYLAK